MSVLAALLIAVGVTDLLRAEGRPATLVRRVVAVWVGVAVLVGSALLSGLTSAADLLLTALSALVIVAWVALGSRADDPTAGPAGVSRPALALGVPALGLAVLLACSGLTSEVGGPMGRWLHGLPLPGLADVGATRALLVCGALLVQFGTANIVVRLVLAGVGAIKPAGQPQASDRLRGGRLLGPMERLVILGLGLAGEVTAAGIVIAAKGLIRWPELQARSRDVKGPSIDEVTEYFLVGSFVSWLVALASLWLAHP